VETSTDSSTLIHREIVQLCALIAAAVVAFFFTREVVVSNRRMSDADAAQWYDRGMTGIRRGDVSGAVDAFRRAAVRNRTDRRYALALANALAANHDDEAARRVLLALRETAPEDPEINVQLARLSAARHDADAAIRYYRSALYAPWPADHADARRGVRVELATLLLDDGRTPDALSELAALAIDLPDSAPLHIQAARLFTRAGDSRRALDQYQRALHANPADEDVLAGAGQSAFALGDYPLARSYLRKTSAADGAAASTREVVELVLSNDPLANRLGTVERRRRLAGNVAYAHERFRACVDGRGEPASTSDLSLLDEGRAFAASLKPSAALEQDAIESGVDLTVRLDRRAAAMCPPETPMDRALTLIGARHETSSP